MRWKPSDEAESTVCTPAHIADIIMWAVNLSVIQSDFMPINEYQCTECKALVADLRHQDPDPNKCPKCGSARSLTKKIKVNSNQGKSV